MPYQFKPASPRLAIFTPYFCHPSETFIVDSSRLDSKKFTVEVVTFELSPFAKQHLDSKSQVQIIKPRNLAAALKDFDLVHVHYLNNLRLIPNITLQNQKVYVTCHGEDIFKYGRDPVYRWQLRNKIKYVTKFLCVSKNLSVSLKRYFPQITNNQIQATPLGIDLTKFPFRPKNKISKVWQIGVAARLVDYKGIDDLIRAGKILKDQKTEFLIHVIGNGPEEKSLKQLAQRLGLRSEIRWHGWLSGLHLIKQLRNLDVYVGPYKTGRGGAQDSMTMILKEVMALGIPVIATAHSAIPELIQSGKHGMLVKPGDPKALAHMLKKLMDQNSLRKKLMTQARKHIETDFNLENQTQSWLEITSSNSRAKRSKLP